MRKIFRVTYLILILITLTKTAYLSIYKDIDPSNFTVMLLLIGIVEISVWNVVRELKK